MIKYPNFHNFISGSRINLHEVDPEHFDDDENNDLYFTPMFTEVVGTKRTLTIYYLK
jgi:hypothetical protein